MKPGDLVRAKYGSTTLFNRLPAQLPVNGGNISTHKDGTVISVTHPSVRLGMVVARDEQIIVVVCDGIVGSAFSRYFLPISPRFDTGTSTDHEGGKLPSRTTGDT